MHEDVKIKSIAEAEQEIQSIRQQVGIMGANNFEIPTIDELLEDLKSGKCKPEEALRQAILIRDRKHDDH